MMDLLAEVARMPSFPAKEVELAKANALQALKVSEATPRFRAERAISKADLRRPPVRPHQPTAEVDQHAPPKRLLRAEHAQALPSGAQPAGHHRPHHAKRTR